MLGSFFKGVSVVGAFVWGEAYVLLSTRPVGIATHEAFSRQYPNDKTYDDTFCQDNLVLITICRPTLIQSLIFVHSFLPHLCD